MFVIIIVTENCIHTTLLIALLTANGDSSNGVLLLQENSSNDSYHGKRGHPDTSTLARWSSRVQQH